MQSNTRRRVASLLCFLTLMTRCRSSDAQDSCSVLTRLPRGTVGFKEQESCTGFCEVWTSLGACLVDPTCFFKTTLSLVEPATYSHLLDLLNVRNPSDIQERMKFVPVLARNAMKDIDDVFERIAGIHLNFEQITGVTQSVLPGSQYQQPQQDLNVSSESNLTCDAKCEFPHKEKCKLSVFCYFNGEIAELQRKNIPLSYLLDLSDLDSEVHKFDDDSVLEELFGQLRIEKIELRTFLAYAFDTYNIMVDINNRNIEYISEYLQNSVFNEHKEFEAQCSTLYRQLAHRTSKFQCDEKFLDFLQFDTPVSFGGLAGGGIGDEFPKIHTTQVPLADTGVVSPRANCPGTCVKVDTNDDCVKDIPCMKQKYNFPLP